MMHDLRSMGWRGKARAMRRMVSHTLGLSIGGSAVIRRWDDRTPRCRASTPATRTRYWPSGHKGKCRAPVASSLAADGAESKQAQTLESPPPTPDGSDAGRSSPGVLAPAAVPRAAGVSWSQAWRSRAGGLSRVLSGSTGRCCQVWARSSASGRYSLSSALPRNCASKSTNGVTESSQAYQADATRASSPPWHTARSSFSVRTTSVRRAVRDW